MELIGWGAAVELGSASVNSAKLRKPCLLCRSYRFAASFWVFTKNPVEKTRDGRAGRTEPESFSGDL
jgi:hypothetical protein